MQQLAINAPPQRIADLPIDERPTERLLKHGAESLSDAELLAVLLDCATMAEAREVAMKLRGDQEIVARALPQAKAARYLAALEMHRRRANADPDPHPLYDPEIVARTLIATYSNHVQERLGAIFLDSRQRIIEQREIYIGTINHAAVSTRDVIRFALLSSASAVVLFHNHPSGDPSPSAEDLMFTRKMTEALKMCDIDLADHVVIGSQRYYSMRQRGQL